MNDEQLHQFCESWQQWCNTRRYFIAPGTKNVLARFQPSKSGQVPDAQMSGELNFFNQAVHALADMKPELAKCFIAYYVKRTKNIKAVIYDLKISRATFYRKRLEFAREALVLSKALRKMYLENDGGGILVGGDVARIAYEQLD